jgi:hypothetical protein
MWIGRMGNSEGLLVLRLLWGGWRGGRGLGDVGRKRYRRYGLCGSADPS